LPARILAGKILPQFALGAFRRSGRAQNRQFNRSVESGNPILIRVRISIRVAIRPLFRSIKKMKRFSPFLYLTLAAFAASAPFCAVTPEAFAQQPSSLYHRLGGYDAIAAVTDDFVGRLATDPQLKRFFTGLSVDSQKKLRQHVVDFLCNATGGPCLYTGRDMKTAHTGLGITEDDWNASVKHLVETLDKFKVPEKEKSEVLGAISGLKGDIVGR
jgi:hemoglobin